jgi:hypothetical protein
VRRVDERVNTGDALSNIEICNQYSRTRGFSGDRFGKNITATILVACTHVRMYVCTHYCTCGKRTSDESTIF